jgi:glutamine---fructose-6-phosphate transaminase (isomerizing)
VLPYGVSLRDEIGEQPAVLERLLREGRSEAAALAAALRRATPCFLLVAARGSSDNAARYAQHLLGARQRLVVALASPSLHTVYGAPPSLRGGAVLAISQSGQSPDVVAVVEDARRQGVPALAITNDPASPLARAATAVLSLRAGEERAVAATKTYTAQLVALAMIAAELEGPSAAWTELEALPAAVASAAASRVSALSAERLVVLGRGYNHGTAHELALKLEETSYLTAQAFSFADFAHGPVAAVDEAHGAIVIAPSGLGGGEETIALLERRGAPVAVISDRPDLLGRAAIPVPLPAGTPEWLSPVVAIVPGQLLALAEAAARGLDPDAPRGLAKVTRTR